MNCSLENYLSISSEPLEDAYLLEQFKVYQLAIDGEVYGAATMSYHLVFLSFYNQVLYKIKKFLPKEHDLVMTLFDQDRMNQFRNAKDSTGYAHSLNRERSMFELLDIFPEAHKTILKCKKRIDYRNQNFGHANYVIIDEQTFYNEVEEYNSCAFEITKLYDEELKKIFEDWVDTLDKDQIDHLIKDDIETGLIIEYKLSLADVEHLKIHCIAKKTANYKKVHQILDEYSLIT